MSIYRWNGDVLAEWKLLQDKMDAGKREWEAFMQSGKPSKDSAIAPEILSSWQRCRDRGINPYDDKVVILSHKQLQERLHENKKMIDAARPILQETAGSIVDSGYRIDLYDKDLYLLMRFGKKLRGTDCERRELIPGESHSESDAGTNATNLAALLERPVQLTAFEHYRICCHELTCASVPLIDQNGELMAVLTVEGWCWPLHKHTLGLLIALKHSIEYRLSKTITEEMAFPDKVNKELIEMMDSSVIVLDSSGKIVISNSKADRTIGRGWENLTGFSAEAVWGSRNPFSYTLKTKKAMVNREFTWDIDSEKALTMGTIKPILDEEDKMEGVIGLFREKQESRGSSGVKRRAHYTFENIIGESPEIKQAIRLASETAGMDNNILILGESGTGKELFAQSIHNESKYFNGPFVAVNCSAIPNTLLESELFGYEGGAFTGAKKEGSPGKFEQATGGTILLDEINSMSLDMQAKILRVIQNKTITRIGGTKEVPVDVRIIAASNVDLWQMVKREEFREDLYYRINVISVRIPPLRERGDDIGILIRHILLKLEGQVKESIELDTHAAALLKRYTWPGNVRELENVLERSWVLAKTNGSNRITLREVMEYRGMQEGSGEAPIEKEQTKAEEVTPKAFDAAERQLIVNALKENGGNIQATAKTLGIARNTLYRKMKKYSLR